MYRADTAACRPTEFPVMLRLAYLTTEYPAISHTFIRRELAEIERRGHVVERFSIRRSSHKPVDPADLAEAERTLVCLEQPLWKFAASLLSVAVRRPRSLLRATTLAIRMGREAGGTGLRHLVYLVEAALLLRVMAQRGVQHVHVHFGHNAATVARLIRRLGGPSYSFVVHGTETLDAPRQLSLGGKVEDAAFAVGASDFCAAQIRRWSDPSQWGKIHVIRCGLDEKFLGPTTPVAGESGTILCVGRFSGEKAQPLLIEAFTALRAGDQRARLVLIGDGDLRARLEAQIRAAGLNGGGVELAGWATGEQVRAHLERCRVLVLPSLMEGLPVVLLEALAAGRPVIASRVAGIPELVEHGVNGWLVTPGRVDELTAAMREAMSAPAERLTRMGLAGRRVVEDRFSAVKEAGRLEELLVRYLSPAQTGNSSASDR